MATNIISCKRKFVGGYPLEMGKVRRQELPSTVSGLCRVGTPSQHKPFSHIPRAFVHGDSNAGGRIDGPLRYRAFARCLAFNPSRWSCFTLYRWLNIHWARERKARDWFYCPVVRVLTWDARDAGSSPCSDGDLIIYTKWNSFSKKDVCAGKPDGPLLHGTKPLPF